MLDFSQHLVTYIISLAFCAVIAYTAFGTVKAFFKSGVIAAIIFLCLGVGLSYLVVNATQGPGVAKKVKQEIDKGASKVDIPTVPKGFGD